MMNDKVKERKSALKRLRRKAIKMQNNSSNRLTMAEAMQLVRIQENGGNEPR
tara:strand:- start:3254 stop:3409 length:156 start_codon:yes stop_codon:yes gene_type:complete